MENNTLTEQLFLDDPRYSICVGARSYVITTYNGKRIPGEMFEIKYDDISIFIIKLIVDGFIVTDFSEEWFREREWSGSTFFKDERIIWMAIILGYITYSHMEEDPDDEIQFSNSTKHLVYHFTPTFKAYWKNYLIHHGKGLNPFV